MGTGANRGAGKEPPGAVGGGTVRPALAALGRLAAGTAFVAVLLALAEGILRLFGFSYEPPPAIIADADIHRANPYWFWEPRPGVEIEQCPGDPVNEDGFRGPRVGTEPTVGLLRIAVLGDSSTFGTRLCSWDTFPALLAGELPGTEVLNFGVIGFSAFQGARLFERRVLDYRPALVILAFGAFNEGRPTLRYDVDERYAISSRTSVRAIRLRESLHPLRIVQALERLVDGPRDFEREARDLADLKSAVSGTPGYKRNQTLASFERSIGEIVSGARARGAEVVLVVPPRRAKVEGEYPPIVEYTAALPGIGSRLGVPVIDMHAVFRAIPDGESVLFMDSLHPGKEGQRFYARALGERLRGLVDGLRGAGRPAAGAPLAATGPQTAR